MDSQNVQLWFEGLSALAPELISWGRSPLAALLPAEVSSARARASEPPGSMGAALMQGGRAWSHFKVLKMQVRIAGRCVHRGAVGWLFPLPCLFWRWGKGSSPALCSPVRLWVINPFRKLCPGPCHLSSGDAGVGWCLWDALHHPAGGRKKTHFDPGLMGFLQAT